MFSFKTLSFAHKQPFLALGFAFSDAVKGPFRIAQYFLIRLKWPWCRTNSEINLQHQISLLPSPATASQDAKHWNNTVYGHNNPV